MIYDSSHQHTGSNPIKTVGISFRLSWLALEEIQYSLTPFHQISQIPRVTIKILFMFIKLVDTEKGTEMRRFIFDVVLLSLKL